MMIERNGLLRMRLGYGICFLAFAFIAWSFYPGIMTADSIAALAQGRANVYGDINAPLMSWLWGRLDSILPGPALIFLIDLAIYWVATALLWKATNGKSLWLGVALVIVGSAPHILAQTVVVWKDVALGVSLFMTVALLYLARSTGSRLAVFVSPLFLFYGYAARLNALPAVLPIAIWTGILFLKIFELERKRARGLLLGFGYFVVLSSAVWFVNFSLTGGKSDFPFEQIYLYDLAAISVERNEAVFPESVRNDPDFALDVVRSRYNERSVADLIFPNIPNPGDRPPLHLTSDGAKVDQLRTAWLDAIRHEPATYLGHRSSVFAQLIGMKRSITAPYVAEGFASNPPEFRGGDNFGYVAMMKYFGAFRRPFPQTFFFRAIVWMILCGVLLVVAIRRRFESDWDLVFVLSASSLLFIAAYFPTAPSTEFRYLFWPAIASAVAVIFGVYLWRSQVGRQRQLATDY